MAKLGCVCGSTIVDQTNDVPYKAQFIRDQDYGKYSDYTADIANFIEAIQSGQRDSWIKKFFSDVYPTNIKNSSVIYDIVSLHENRVTGYLYQCEDCGRVKIQVGNSHLYSSFKPEDDHFKNLFLGLSNK